MHAKAVREDATFVGGTTGEAIERPDRDPFASESPKTQAIVEEAYKRGLEQGRSETEAAYRQEADNAVSALNAAIAEMIRVHRQDLAAMEAETVRLALAITKQVVGDQRDKADAIRHVVNAAMEKVSNPRQLTLRLNPADIETVTQMKAELSLGDDPDMAFELQPDDTIGRGGCIIETQLGDVDARIEQQLSIIETMLDAELTRTSMES